MSHSLLLFIFLMIYEVQYLVNMLGLIFRLGWGGHSNRCSSSTSGRGFNNSTTSSRYKTVQNPVLISLYMTLTLIPFFYELCLKMNSNTISAITINWKLQTFSDTILIIIDVTTELSRRNPFQLMIALNGEDQVNLF